MVCHVLIRRTRDWDTVRTDSLDAPFLCRAAAEWDRCFRLGYGACRARIKAIATDNLRALPARVTEPKGPGDVDRAAVQDGDAVLLCDDDDLFHPQLVEHLRAVREAGAWDRLVVWPDGKHGFHAPRNADTIALLPRVLERPLVEGSYRGPYCAIPGRLLHRAPDILDAAWTHSGIVDYFRQQEPPVTKVSTPLSLIAKHPCSVSVLRRALAGGAIADGDIAGALRRLVEQYVRGRTELPPPFRWAAGDVARLAGVFRDALGR